MTELLNPLKAEQFLEAVKTRLAPAEGTYIYEACIRNYLEKTSPNDSSGYVQWLRELLPYLSREASVQRGKVLDLGCGTGELTVLMNLIGFDSTGVDVHEQDIRLAKMLARENGLSENMFVYGDGEDRLPFADDSFDIVTMISVLEHTTDQTLQRLVPELARICRGVVFVQAPNKLSISDDHTGLKFVPWMPHWLARHYVAARGDRYRYYISASGSWDVHYRNFEETIATFQDHFDYAFSPDACCFPKQREDDLLLKIGKTLHFSNRNVFVGVPLPWRRIRMKMGYPKEAYYPYINLIFKKKFKGEKQPLAD